MIDIDIESNKFPNADFVSETVSRLRSCETHARRFPIFRCYFIALLIVIELHVQFIIVTHCHNFNNYFAYLFVSHTIQKSLGDIQKKSKKEIKIFNRLSITRRRVSFRYFFQINYGEYNMHLL